VLNEAEAGQVMLTIDARALLQLPRPFTDDQLSDLIATVIDDLDKRALDPSLSTYQSDEGVRIEVSMTFDTDDPFLASALALNALQSSFDSAVPSIAAMTHDLVLQEA
jgi:hypothetical protein